MVKVIKVKTWDNDWFFYFFQIADMAVDLKSPPQVQSNAFIARAAMLTCLNIRKDRLENSKLIQSFVFQIHYQSWKSMKAFSINKSHNWSRKI